MGVIGSHHSPESKAKIGAAARGRRHNEGGDARISAAMMGNQHRKGIPHTLEVRARLREHHMSHDCKAVHNLRRNVGPTSIETELGLLLSRAFPLALIEREYKAGRYRLDFAIPAMMLAFEADGEYWHDADHDAKRDAWLGSQGWQVVRYTGTQIREAFKRLEVGR